MIRGKLNRREWLKGSLMVAGSGFLGEHLVGAGAKAPALLSPCGIAVAPGDWPWWRGPSFNNVSPEKSAPLTWAADKNVVWKIELSGRGHASPIVSGNRIFIATAEESREQLWMHAYRRKDGKHLWKQMLSEGGFMAKHDKNSHASATPACDGQMLFFPALHHGALWLYGLKVNGRVPWKQRVTDFVPSNGYGSSPVLFQDKVIVAADNTGSPCIAAYKRKTGELAWRTERPKSDNFSSPAIAVLAGKPQLIICGAKMLAAYDPQTGKIVWHVESPTEVTATTVAFGEDYVIGGGNVPIREYICAKADGSGDVTGSAILWRSKKNVSYVPAPIVHEGLLYIINDNGIAACLDPLTEKEHYKERLSTEGFTSSPVIVGNKIFITSEHGKTHVLQTGPDFELVATNDLKEETLSTPAPAGGRWFIRTSKHLWCIE